MMDDKIELVNPDRSRDQIFLDRMKAIEAGQTGRRAYRIHGGVVTTKNPELYRDVIIENKSGK
jgi:hypothetical protein